MEAETPTEPPLEMNADVCHALADDLHKQGRAEEAETFYRAAPAGRRSPPTRAMRRPKSTSR
jgi:hypothetical protein